MNTNAALVKGINDLPKVVLASDDGARAEIYLHGAHLTSWVPAGGEECLFLSRSSHFDPASAIRGGVPVIFPQFAGRGPLPKHGFARTTEWELLETFHDSPRVGAAFRLTDSDATRQIWPHPFNAELGVFLHARQIKISLKISNGGPSAFSFTAALHTYLRTPDIAATVIAGLNGLSYFDSTAGDRLARQEESPLTFNGEVDRIYLDTPSPLVVTTPAHSLSVESSGFPNAVVWNPWQEKGAALSDLEPDGYRRMVCVEAGVIGRPVFLQPGESWQGFQRLIEGRE